VPHADDLLVADYNQRNIYQITPQSGEMRVLPMYNCKPVSLIYDPNITGIYVICDEQRHFRIEKKTFDGTVDKVIYRSPEGTFTGNILRTVGLSKLSPVRHSYVPM